VPRVALSPQVVLGFSYEAPYEDLERGPVADFELAALDFSGVLSGTYTTGMIIDSGAAFSLLDAEVAGHLGIDLSDRRYEKGRATGIAGQWLPTAEAPVQIRICDRWIEVPVRFATAGGPVRALLGRRGVFDRVALAFDPGPRRVLAAY